MEQQQTNLNITNISTYTVDDVLKEIHDCEQEYQDLVIHQRHTLQKCEKVIRGQQDLLSSTHSKISSVNGKLNKKNY